MISKRKLIPSSGVRTRKLLYTLLGVGIPVYPISVSAQDGFLAVYISTVFNWWPSGYRGTPKIFWYTGKKFTSDHSSKVSIFNQHLLRHSPRHTATTIVHHTNCPRVHLMRASSTQFHVGKMSVVRPSYGSSLAWWCLLSLFCRQQLVVH